MAEQQNAQRPSTKLLTMTCSILFDCQTWSSKAPQSLVGSPLSHPLKDKVSQSLLWLVAVAASAGQPLMLVPWTGQVNCCQIALHATGHGSPQQGSVPFSGGGAAPPPHPPAIPEGCAPGPPAFGAPQAPCDSGGSAPRPCHFRRGHGRGLPRWRPTRAMTNNQPPHPWRLRQQPT